MGVEQHVHCIVCGQILVKWPDCIICGHVKVKGSDHVWHKVKVGGRTVCFCDGECQEIFETRRTPIYSAPGVHLPYHSHSV